MRKFFKPAFISILLLSCISTYGQEKQTLEIGSEKYNSLKQNGQLHDLNEYELSYPTFGRHAETPLYSGIIKMGGGGVPSYVQCGQLVVQDSLATPSVPGTVPDDGSSSLIQLPFDFCFYGALHNSFYVNDNGNISFNAPSGAFSSNAFPNTLARMIAPFWADVHNTADPLNHNVGYEVFSNFAIIKWDSVGYYNGQYDKRNTFQVIISDGSSNVIPGGNNVAFIYGDMQWTTGSASQGTNGFGGIPATVGVNFGDGVQFIQIGRFDHAGVDYDGPVGNNDGVSWLDNQVFAFNVCPASGGNIPPVLSNYSIVCDTLQFCHSGSGNDTLQFRFDFISPEAGQTTTTTFDTTGVDGLVLTNNTSGITSHIDGYFEANANNEGINVITFTATDDGTPPQSTSFQVVVNVTQIDDPIIIGDSSYCYPGSVNVELVNNEAFDHYQWSDGSLSPDSIVTYNGGNHTLHVYNADGCVRELNFDVIEYGNYQYSPNIQTISCYQDSNGAITYNPLTAEPFTFVWTNMNGDTLSGIDTLANVPSSITNLPDGTYYLEVMDINGCNSLFIDTVTLTEPNELTDTIESTPESCYDNNGTVTVTPAGGTSPFTYSWSPVSGTQPQLSNLLAGVYTVTITDNNGCVRIDSILVDSIISVINDPVIGGDSGYCYPGTANVELINNDEYMSYQWSSGETSPDSIVELAAGTYAITATNSDGCMRTTTFSIEEWANFQISNTVDQITCYGSDNGLISYNLSQSDPLLYVWTNSIGDTIQTGIASTGDDALQDLGPGVYTVFIADTHNCVLVDDTLTIIEPDELIADKSSMSETCQDTNGVAMVTPYGGTTPYIFNWQPASGSQSVLDNLLAGEYTVTITDANGCEHIDTIVVDSVLIPIADFNSSLDTAITQELINFSDLSDGLNDTISEWYWDFGDGSTSDEQNPVYAYTDTGSYTVSLIVTNTDGCVDTITSEIFITKLFIPNVFTPDGDGINDYFEIPYLQTIYPGSGLTLYNRWGRKVYDQTPYMNDWNAEKCKSGTYFYELRLSDGSLKTGTIVIIK